MTDPLPLTLEEEATLREWAALEDVAVRFTSAEARRLLATLDAARAVPAGLDVERLREALRQAEWEFSRLGRDNFALLMREALDGHPGGTKNIGRPAAKENDHE